MSITSHPTATEKLDWITETVARHVEPAVTGTPDDIITAVITGLQVVGTGSLDTLDVADAIRETVCDLHGCDVDEIVNAIMIDLANDGITDQLLSPSLFR